MREHLTPAVYQDILDFAYFSGWRRGEVIGLTWREIDVAGSVIRLDPDRSKTRTGRLLPMSQPLKEVLQRRVAARRLDCLMVFHHDGDEDMNDSWKAWKAACKLAGLPGKKLHDCRRTAARNLIRSGTERVAMQLTGHKTRSVFDRYNIVSESDLRAGVDRLAAYVEEASEGNAR